MWELPFILFRGGTSKGPFFMRATLPADPLLRNKILLDLMGSPHQIQADGIGGGHALANKVCIVGASKRSGIHVDYLLCQVHVNKALVETTIDCGNMLAAVGPYAIETGLVKATHPETKVKIYSENTGVIIEAIVQTPHSKISYGGDTHIDGIAGTGSPIKLNFLNPAGSTTGKMLPTGRAVDVIDTFEVSCIDVSMPMIIIAAESLNKTGYESKLQLDSDHEFMDKLENIRLKAAKLMGLGDVTGQTMPKICLVAKPAKNGHIASRYIIAPFEYDCHPSFAVTGAMCLSAACFIQGSIANKFAILDAGQSADLAEKLIRIEHPSGCIEASVKLSQTTEMNVESVSYIRTARPLAKGNVFVPGDPTKEFQDILFLQTHFRRILAEKKSSSGISRENRFSFLGSPAQLHSAFGAKELASIKDFVITQYQNGVTHLLANNKYSDAIELINLVKEEKFIDAQQKLKLIFDVDPLAPVSPRS